jgi:tRNA (uracil-5-)-methyltransferase TRM9
VTEARQGAGAAQAAPKPLPETNGPNSTSDVLLGDQGNGQGGRALLYVWALEQRGSRRGWDEGAQQDQLVPWVLVPQQQQHPVAPRGKRMREKRPRGAQQEPASMQATPAATDPTCTTTAGQNIPPASLGSKTLQPRGSTYQRYYHLYRRGELEEDVVAAGGTVLAGGYERDNWWVVAGRKQGDEA